MKKLLRSLLAVMLISMMAVSLASCGISSDPKKTKEKLEAEGYSVMLEQVNLGEALGDKTEAYLVASNGEENVTITWYKNADDAKAAYEELEESYKKAKKELKEMEDGELKDALKKKLDNVAYGRSGKIVWFGTKAGVKAAK